MKSLQPQVAFALAHPVYDPLSHINRTRHFWKLDNLSLGLTVNIGME